MRDVLSGGAYEDYFGEARKMSVGRARLLEIIPAPASPTIPTLYLTDHDQPLTVGANTYAPTSAFAASAIRWRADASVDNLSITGITKGSVTEDDLRRGYYDDAEVRFYDCHWTDLPGGKLPRFRGYMGEIKLQGLRFEFEVRGLMEYMQRPIGRSYVVDCPVRRFGDSVCGLDIVALGYVHSGTVSSLGSENRRFGISVVQADGYFANGEFQFTSGDNAGWQDKAYLHAADAVTLFRNPPFPVQIGDGFQIERGCPRTYAFCQGQNNLVNYRGFPARKGVAGYFHPIDRILAQTPNAKG